MATARDRRIGRLRQARRDHTRARLNKLHNGEPVRVGDDADLAEQAAQKGGEIARWLEDREPRDVLDEVKSFARRRPVTFLALCGLAGVVAGRLTRGAVAANTSIDSPSTSSPGRRAVATGPSPRAVETGRSVQELPATPLYDEVLTSNPDLAGPGSGYQGDRSGGMR